MEASSVNSACSRLCKEEPGNEMSFATVILWPALQGNAILSESLAQQAHMTWTVKASEADLRSLAQAELQSKASTQVTKKQGVLLQSLSQQPSSLDYGPAINC